MDIGDLSTAVGVGSGLGGIALTVVFAVSQSHSARIGLDKLCKQMAELQSHMVSRFDKIEGMLQDSGPSEVADA
jgi:hypothetical protein